MKKKFFTLIELLIVISIIAILAGMLLPALSMARDRARTIQCAGNLKQLSMGILQYAIDSRDFYPHIPNPEPTGEPMLIWDDLINEYAPVPRLTQTEKEARFVKIRGRANAYLCPSDRSGVSAYGADFYRRTYALTRGTANPAEYEKYPGIYGAGAAIRQGEVRFPSQTFAIVEMASDTNTLGYTSNASVQNAAKQWTGNPKLHGIYRYNYAYADGHVGLKNSREGDLSGTHQNENRSPWNARRTKMQ